MADAPSMDQLKESLNESTDDEESSVDEEVQNAPGMNMRPESAVHFDEIVDFGFAGKLTDEQNIAGADGFGGSIAITVRNPTIGGGDLYQSTDPSQSAEYKLVGDYNVEPKYNADGEIEGIDYGSTFTGELVDEFKHDLVTLYVSGGMGTYVGQCLDALGIGIDEHPNGLVEFPTEGADERAAIRGAPILRADMEERGGAIMASFYDDADLDGERAAFRGSVFKETDGDYTELTPVRDTDHEGYHEDVEDRFVADAHWTDAPSSDASVEDSLDLSSAMNGSTDELSDEWEAFADQVAAQDVGVEDLDVGVLAEGFSSDNDLDDVPSTETLVDAIESRE